MKTTWIVILLLQAYLCHAESQQLYPGDIAITGFNFRDPDQFSFITFKDLLPGTEIHFTDCGWKNTNSFRENEGIVTYTVPEDGKKAFEVITYNSDPGFVTTGVDGFFGLSLQGDQILVYQGDFTNPSFLYALNNNESSWQADAIDNNTSALPPGLTPGLTAIALNEAENQVYNCVLESGSLNALLTAMATPSNWQGSIVRFDLPGPCFEDALPIKIVDFRIQGTTYPHICFKIHSDENSEVEIEWSDNGELFQTIYSVTLQPQEKFELCQYDYQHSKGYYRVKITDQNGIVSFSETHYFDCLSEKPVMIQWITLEGVLLSQQRESDDMNFYQKHLYPGTIILKKIYYTNRVITEKILIENLE